MWKIRDIVLKFIFLFCFFWEFYRGFELYYIQGIKWEEEEFENIFVFIFFGDYVGLFFFFDCVYIQVFFICYQGVVCDGVEE